MICRICGKEFVGKYKNRSLCSAECKTQARKIVLLKYKNSGKRLLSARRLYKSEKKKISDKKYRQTEGAKRLAVERSKRHLKKSPETQEKRKRIERIYIRRTQGRLRKWWKSISSKGCLMCGAQKSLSIDHIVPMSKGGTDDLWNLQCLCVSCNAKKGNKIWQS